jgi:hypothetical protein
MRMVEWEALDIAWKNKSELLVHGRDGKIREPARTGTPRAGRRANAWGGCVFLGGLGAPSAVSAGAGARGTEAALVSLEGRCAFASKTENHRRETVGDRRPLGQRKIEFRQHLSDISVLPTDGERPRISATS